MAAAAAPSVLETSHDGASMDGAAAAPNPRMAVHVVSNAVAPDYSVQRLGASKLECPPRLGWTASWSTGFVDYYPITFLLVT